MFWLLVVAPLVLLPIIFLLGFVGCGLNATGDAPPSHPDFHQVVKLFVTDIDPSFGTLTFSCKQDSDKNSPVSKTVDFQTQAVDSPLSVTVSIKGSDVVEFTDVTGKQATGYALHAWCALADTTGNSLMDPLHASAPGDFAVAAKEWSFTVGKTGWMTTPSYAIAGPGQVLGA